jgi:hypothetical protein
VRLYQLYTLLKDHPSELETPTDSAFNKKHPEYDGVCMGNRKACKVSSMQTAGMEKTEELN